MSVNTSARRLFNSSVLHLALGVSFLLALTASAASAQSDAAGTTPSGLAPGAPAGSYAMSGFENVNLFNGNLNFHLPLLGISGRGGAGHAPTLKIDQTWTVITNFNDQTGAYTYVPEPNWWDGIKPGYGPGVLQARHGGGGSVRCGTTLTGFFNVVTKTLTRLTFSTSDGTEYELRDQQTGGRPQPKDCTNYDTQYNRGRVFVTADGTSATFVSDADVTDRARFSGEEGLVTRHSGFLLLRDGTRYRIDDGTVTWIRDRNGNLVSFTYDVNKRVTSITDSLGRQVTVAYDQAEGGQYGTCDRITFNGFGGIARVLRVCKTNLGGALRATRPADVTTPQTLKALFPELDGSNSTSYNPMVVGSVWLPDGQRRYQLFYNQYGELARVVLPTGGAIEYDHTGGFVGGSASGAFGPARNKHIYRRVVERRAYPNGADLNNFENRTAYSRPESISNNAFLSSVGYVTTEQFDADGSRKTFERHYFNGTAYHSFSVSPVHYASWQDGREYKTELFDSAGATVLRRVENTWRQRAGVPWWDSTQGPEPPNDPRLVTTVTTVEPAGANLVSKTTALDPADTTGQAVGFDRYNNQTDSWDFDYGVGAPGPLLRRTHTDFLYTNPANGADYACDPATTCSNASITPGVVHLRGLPAQQWISSDAFGSNKLSLTTYAYDQFGLTDRAGITGMCTAFAGAQCTSNNSTAYVTRGNVTTVTRYANAAVGTGGLAETSSYDVAGNVVSTTDAKGNTSQVSYADSFCNGSACGGSFTPNTYAFPASATSPVPDPTGAYGSTAALATSTIYDFWTGLVYSATDANGQTTTFSYADEQGNLDPLDRLKKVTRPGGGRTTYTYVDAHQCGPYVETHTLLDNSGRETGSWQFFDGLGRPYLAETLENQDANNPYLRVDTQYDALGRAWRASNQYRSPGCAAAVNPSGRWTETTFDSISRPVQVKTTGDNAAVTTAYSGNTATVMDQAGRKRRSVSDALGRVVRVDEPDANGNLDSGGSPVQPTSYSYDALGSLRKVDQGGQLRFFMYDSLGRLVRAKNPEQATNASLAAADPVTGNGQWSLAYAYDANGNLQTRTDARGVTTTYGYDGLNRSTTIDYSDTAENPDVSRFYDGGPNGRGLLWWDRTSGASESQTGYNYDAVGRVTNRWQYFKKADGSWSQRFMAQYGYDLAGNPTSLTYPSGHTVSYGYDVAGRPNSFSGNLGEGVSRTYAADVTYSELGGIQQERFGTQTPLYHKLHYTSRGQLFDIRLSTVPWAADQWNWNRGCVALYFSLANVNTSSEGPDNNGNVVRQQHWVPGDDSVSNYSYTQDTFAYDSLNRLKSVSELHGGPWGQSGQDLAQAYAYDRWGNRTIDAGQTSGAASTQFDLNPPSGTWEVPEPSNRLYAAGDNGRAQQDKLMRYDAAGNLVYDAYSAGGGGARLYDAENRMTAALDRTGNWASYAYDADGRRVRRKAANDEWWQVYGAGGELLAEYRSGAAPFAATKEYGYRGGELLVTMSSGDDQRLRRFVTNLYYGALQRDPTAQELQDASNQLASAGAQGQAQLLAKAKEVARGLFLQTAYETATGRSDTQYVADLYYTYLQRAPDDGGLNWWAPQAAGGTANRGSVCDAFQASSEFEALVSTLYGTAAGDDQRTEQFVNNFYLAAYGRFATSAELQQQRDALNAAAAQGQGQAQSQAEAMGRGLFAAQVNDYSISDRQYVTNLYEGFLQRGPDAGGLNFWAGSAAGGAQNRQSVLNAFATCGPARELAGALYRETFWLVSDHLGTPRMIADKSGSLAGVKRHDYLPFGEELYVGAGGRAPGQGYANDGVRQKFALYERDTETELDYVHARYYANALGRFTGADPDNAGARVADPQSWNGYAYVSNNPLRCVDPSGRAMVCRANGQIVSCAWVLDQIRQGNFETVTYTNSAGVSMTVRRADFIQSRSYTTRSGAEGTRVTFNQTAFLARAAVFSEFLQQELEKNGEAAPGAGGFGGAGDFGGSGAGSGDCPSCPAFEDDPYNPDVVRGRIQSQKPQYRINPIRSHSRSRFNPRKTPEPADAEEVYDAAVRSTETTWIGRNAKGEYYQFYDANDGTAHFAGKIPESKVPKDVRKQLQP